MEPTIPQWLDAAVAAAGITTIYNADDWLRFEEKRDAANAPRHDDLAANDPSAAPH